MYTFANAVKWRDEEWAWRKCNLTKGQPPVYQCVMLAHLKVLMRRPDHSRVVVVDSFVICSEVSVDGFCCEQMVQSCPESESSGGHVGSV